MKEDRPLARLVLTLGLLILGAVALARLPLDYLPRQSFPELTVTLALDDPSDPATLTREWLEEIESAVRSVGRVEEVAGEVTADGARLTVRFAPGTDPERKASRLDSDLAGLRRRLPGHLWITPAAETGGDFLAIVWLAGSGREATDRAAEAAAEELRAVPGVQQVTVYGTLQEEVRVTLRGAAPSQVDPWGEAESVRAEVESALRAPALGRVRRNGHERPVIVPPVAAFETLVIPRDSGAVALGALADVRTHWKAPLTRVRFGGRPARALFVWRTHGSSLLRVDQALRDRLARLPGGLRGLRGTVDQSAAAPLRTLVARLALGLLLASIAAAFAGAWLGGKRGALGLGLALPATVAAAANAFWLAGIGLDVTTLVALALGSAAVLPAALLRLVHAGRRTGAGFRAWAGVALAAAVVVRVTVALGSAELGPILAEPARAFLLAVAGAVVAAAVVPVPSLQSLKSLGSLLPPFRDPGTIFLFAATAAYIAAALFGPALMPEPAELEPDDAGLVVRLRLPEGATLDETERRVREVEAQLVEAPEIESFWSRSGEGEGFVSARLRREHRRPDRLAVLITRLRYRIPASGTLDIRAGNGPVARPRERTLEDIPEADKEGQTYKAVLRSADLQALVTAYDRILGRLAGLKVRPYWIQRYDTRTVRLALLPRPGSAPERNAAVAAFLRRASLPPPEARLPRDPAAGEGTGRTLLVIPAGMPTEPSFVPQLTALLEHPLLWQGEPLLAGSAVTVREEALLSRVPRQSGRFVLPIELRILMTSEDARLNRRKEIDRSLSQLALPVGCDLDRPPLSPWLWQTDRMRLIALAVAVPLLLFAVAACRLGSFLRALAALAPLALGLLAAAPVVRSGLGQADDLTVFALVAGLALAFPAVTEGTLASSSGRPSRLYRRLRLESPWIVGAVPALLLGLAAPTLGLDPLQVRWVVPLRAATVAGGGALLASVLLSPALLLLGRGAAERLRHPEDIRRRGHPPAWTAPEAPATLEARNVTKTYGGGVTALAGVRFELAPGIVGLLGPNGAGKTTLLRILTGLLDPSRGEVRFRGVAVSPENLSEYRRQIGFLPQEFNAYPELTAEQFLDHWAAERGMGEAERRREIERLLDAVDLTEHARRKVRDYSGGMRQRVGIARALLGSPPILIVDEPTTGLDVESRARFRQILLEQAVDRVVLFSTHIASDVEAAAARILLLHRGRLRFDGTPEELTDRARGRAFQALVTDDELAGFGRRYRVTARVRTLEGIRARAVARPGDPFPGEAVEPNLEEAYLAEIDLAEASAGDPAGR